MANGTGKSGQQVAEENVQALVEVLARFGDAPLPRYHSELNRSTIAGMAGFDRKVFQTNPRCARLLEEADQADRERHLNALAKAELSREDKGRLDRDRSALEAQNLRLMAEVASMHTELARLRRLERVMCATGKLP